MSPFQVVLLIFAACAVALVAVILAVVVRWNARLWLPSYIRSARKRRRLPRSRRLSRPSRLTHILFAVVDHFEPVPRPGHGPEKIGGAMADWMTRYPDLAARHRDSDGRPPRHTWAFPVEAYRPEYLEQLVELCRRDLGEVEVQIHHDGDTATTFRARMTEGLNRFASHGIATIRGREGHHFAFVHGNWALANSRPDRRWCGVNNEITVLRELGCFADATLPSAPSPTQTSKINSIYYATGNPDRPKSHDSGVDVEVGRSPSGDLMIIQGPLLLDWSERKLGLLPSLDNGEITDTYPATAQRVDAWARAGIAVIHRPEWVFIKVHCHGALIRDRNALLGAPADDMLSYLENEYGSAAFRLHYVTLREMYNIIKAAEAGKSGNPNDYRDFVLPAYDCVRTGDAPRGVSK